MFSSRRAPAKEIIARKSGRLAVVRIQGNSGAQEGGPWLAACSGGASGIVLAQYATTELTPEQYARLQWEDGDVLRQLGKFKRALKYVPGTGVRCWVSSASEMADCGACRN